MRKLFSFVCSIVLVALVLGACNLPAPSGPTTPAADLPSATPAEGQPEATIPPLADGLPTPTISIPPKDGIPAVTATPLATAQANAVQPEAKPVDPTATPLPPVTVPTQRPDAGTQPTATPLPGPVTATALPAHTSVAFDPRIKLGEPTFHDTIDNGTKTNWVIPTTGKLPNDENIQLAVKDSKMYVTGKNMYFSTWWFSWPELKDFYIELVVDTETCSGKDSYGLIVRGPQHNSGVSYGYVVALSCDGSYWVYRLDGADPFRAVNLVDWTASSLIRTGSNRMNTLGVQMVGNALTVFINGSSVVQVKDSEYSQGRYGLFVYPDSTYLYTYHAIELNYWDLSKPK